MIEKSCKEVSKHTFINLIRTSTGVSVNCHFNFLRQFSVMILETFHKFFISTCINQQPTEPSSGVFVKIKHRYRN